MSRPRVIAWGLFGIAMVLAAASAALVLSSIGAPVPDVWGFRGYWAVIAPLIATPGLLIALRQPASAIGWLLLIAGLRDAFGGFAQEYATFGLLLHPGSLPGALALAWINSWTFGVEVSVLLVLLPLLFPTGRPLTPRWVPIVVGSPGLLLVLLIGFGIRPGPLENAPFVDNPVVLDPGQRALRDAIAIPLEMVIAAFVVASGASAILRARRSRGIERQQLKWFALSAAILTVGMLGILLTTPVDATNGFKPAQIFMVFAFSTAPIAVAIAILRYRLYDIDLIINRAIVYGALSALLAGSYFALVVVLQAALRPLTGGSEIAVAASTLGTIALFQPLRRRIQDGVDRRFYRSRYDAARALDTLATRLRDEVDLDAVRGEVVLVVAETVAPRHASLWLRGRPS